MSTILITGATNGIGLETAVALARKGNRLVLLGRDQGRMDAAVDEVKRRSGVAAAPESWLCDFGSQAQIRKLAVHVLARYDRLDVLVNNAGLATRRRELTEDGIERTRHCAERGIAGLPEELPAVRVDEMDAARVADGLEGIPGVEARANLVGSADDGNRSRAQQPVDGHQRS